MTARDDLRAAVRRGLERAEGPRPYLAGEPGTVDPFDGKLWRVLATEIGVPGLVVPEELDGAGGSVADLAVVAEELGRTLAPVPFLSTVALAGTALLGHLDDAHARDLLRRVALGDVTATLTTSGPAVRAELDGARWSLTGDLGVTVDLAHADVLLVAARTDRGPVLFAVDGDAPGVQRRACRSLDLTRPLGTGALRGAPARPVGEPGADRLAVARDLAHVLLAAEQVGGAAACLERAVEHAKQRVQFGRPIGSFQAIAHLLVEVLLDVELARSAAAVAVAAADEHLAAPDAGTAQRLAVAAAAAAATCAEAYLHTAEETLHVHGGTGFTWEHDAHLHFRRAKAGELLLGTPHAHRDRLATAAGL